MNLRPRKGDAGVGIIFALLFIAILIWIFWGNITHFWHIITSDTSVIIMLILLLIPCVFWIAILNRRHRRWTFLESWEWLTLILVIIAGVGILWGIWIKIHHSFVYSAIYYSAIFIPIIVWGLLILRRNNVVDASSQFQYVSSITETNQKSYTSSTPTPPTIEETVIGHIKQFKPNWIRKNGKRRLEGGELGNNANLALFLREKGLKVETEESLSNGSRADLIINGNLILECKKHLFSTDTLHQLSGEVKRARKLSKYQVYALIYGDARNDLHHELCDEIGANSVLLLGNLVKG